MASGWRRGAVWEEVSRGEVKGLPRGRDQSAYGRLLRSLHAF